MTQSRIMQILLLLFGLIFCLVLGVWQWHRASEKHVLLAMYDAARSSTTFVPLTRDNLRHLPRYQKVVVHGYWDTAHTIFLGGQFHDHHAGYRVLTPLFMDSTHALLVDRGWIPYARGILTSTPLPSKEVSVTGWLSLWPSHGVRLGSPIEHKNDTLRVAYLDRKMLHATLNYTLEPRLLLTDQPTPSTIVGGLPPERHVAYAIQWFGLALVCVVGIFLVGRGRCD